MSRGKHRVFVGKALFMSYSAASALIYTELAAGGLFPRPMPRESAYESDPAVGWRMRADFTGTYTGKRLRTNGDGFRSPEIDVEKGKDVVRVVCLGDSLTFGHGVEEHDAYPQQLQRLLSERTPARRWEVINTGVEGYSTFQETEELRRCLKYKPDLVVLLFCLNDVTEKYLSLRRFGGTGLDYHGVLDGLANGFWRGLAWMRQYSSLATALTPTRANAQRAEDYALQRLWSHPDAKPIRGAWEQAERELDELRAECDTHGLGLLIVVAPVRAQLAHNPGIDAPQRRLERYTQTHGIEFVDLRPWLSQTAVEAGVDVETFYMESSHLTAAGNAVIAETIADRFQVSQSSRALQSSSWQRVMDGLLWREAPPIP